MLITLCLIILGYMIVGKDVKPLVERLKAVDWKSKFSALADKLKEYAVKAGRMAARPLLQFYYVMTDAETTTLEKVVVIAFVYKKVKDKITPAINLKVDETIEEWFGPDYTVSEVR